MPFHIKLSLSCQVLLVRTLQRTFATSDSISSPVDVSRRATMLISVSQTVFGSRHPYLVWKIFGGTPSWFNRYKDRGIVTIHLITAPYCAAAPWLGTTDVDHHQKKFIQFSSLSISGPDSNKRKILYALMVHQNQARKKELRVLFQEL